MHRDNDNPRDSYSIEELQEMAEDGRAPVVGSCGCVVEPDGRCPHGNESYLLRLGII